MCHRAGVKMASGGADKVVRLWDPDTGQQSGALHGMTETVTDLAWTCDAKFLLASGADQAVRMWDVSSGRVRHTLTGHTQKARHLPGQIYRAPLLSSTSTHSCKNDCALSGHTYVCVCSLHVIACRPPAVLGTDWCNDRDADHEGQEHRVVTWALDQKAVGLT